MLGLRGVMSSERKGGLSEQASHGQIEDLSGRSFSQRRKEQKA
jgi:hypothetical protein